MSTPHIAGRRPMVLTLEAGSYSWCTCGKSASQPFCDGSHAGSDFRPQKFEIAEKQQVAICMCKSTENGPFCDGGHKHLPKETTA